MSFVPGHEDGDVQFRVTGLRQPSDLHNTAGSKNPEVIDQFTQNCAWRLG